MKSLDSNILLYGTNEDCAEHSWARPVVEALLEAPDEWILADQVLFEYYRLVRNPTVLSRPLGAAAAAAQVHFFREQAGCQHCGYEIGLWQGIYEELARSRFQAGRTFDVVLAATLRANGVSSFYTRNRKHFEGFAWFEVVNPEVRTGAR